MTIFRKPICPHCGQLMAGTFAGVHFTPARYRILKAIAKNPGITIERLKSMLYPGASTDRVIHSTITAINSLFAGTDFQIKGKPLEKITWSRKGYYLVDKSEEEGRRKKSS